MRTVLLMIDSGVTWSDIEGGGSRVLLSRGYTDYSNISTASSLLIHITPLFVFYRRLVGWTLCKNAWLIIHVARCSPPSAPLLVSSKVGRDLSWFALLSGLALLEVKDRLSPSLPVLSMAFGTHFIWMPGQYKWPMMDILWILWTIPAVIAVEGKPTSPSQAASCQRWFGDKAR